MLTSVAGSSVRSDGGGLRSCIISHLDEMGGKCSWRILGQTLFFPLTRLEGASVVLHSSPAASFSRVPAAPSVNGL